MKRFFSPAGLFALLLLVPLVIPAMTTIPRAAAAAEILPLPGKLTAGTTQQVIEVVDADTVRLDDNGKPGRQVRLVGLQGPKLPLGRPNYPTWPLAPQARAHLVALIGSGPVTLHFGGAREDRHGRILAHLTTAEGTWVQGAMLAAGYARVYTFDDNRSLIPEMLKLEAEARAAKRGIWSNDYYRIRTPETLQGTTDSFQIVEGRVLAVGLSRDRAFLNFGPDYKTDFTIAIAKRDFKNFGRGFDPKRFEGERLRVRGWVEAVNGPSIDVTHPEQIEVLAK